MIPSQELCAFLTYFQQSHTKYETNVEEREGYQGESIGKYKKNTYFITYI